MRTSGLAVLTSVACAASISAQSPNLTLERAISAYGKVKTVRASFTQTITNPLLEMVVVSKGEMLQRRPKLAAVRFTDPAGDRIIADGKWIWLYLPSSNPGQVVRMPVGQTAAGTVDLTARFLDQPRIRYTVTDAGSATIGGRPAHALTLVPRDSTADFTRAVIWVDDADGLIRQFETTEANDIVRRVTITKFSINPRIDTAVFKFTPPKGVKVFDEQGTPVASRP